MSDSVSKYFEKKEDEEHWRRVAQEKAKEDAKSSFTKLIDRLTNWINNITSKFKSDG